MSQSDVVEWLCACRSSGDDRYFSVKEIREAMKIKGYGYLNIDLQVSQLYHYGVLEMRTRKPSKTHSSFFPYDGLWRRSYRIKAKYVGGKT